MQYTQFKLLGQSAEEKEKRKRKRKAIPGQLVSGQLAN
jgi:hypothetical protein